MLLKLEVGDVFHTPHSIYEVLEITDSHYICKDLLNGGGKSYLYKHMITTWYAYKD